MPAPSYITQSDPYSIPSYLSQTTTPGGGTGFTHNQFPNSLYVRDAGGFKLLDQPIPGPTVGGSPKIANVSPAPASPPAPATLPYGTGGTLPPQDPNLRVGGPDFYGHFTVYDSGHPGGAVYAEGDPNLLAARQAIAQRDQAKAKSAETAPGGSQQPPRVPQPQNPLNAIPGESYAQYEARLGFPQGNQPQPKANPANFAQPGQDFNAYEASQGFLQTGTQTPQGGQEGGNPQVQGAETVADPLQPLKDLLQSYGITPDANQAVSNPLGTFDDVYQKVYTQLGLGDLKTHIENLTKQLADVDKRIVDKQISINSNPWLSEGARVKQLNALTKATHQERANILNELKLNEAEFDRGRHDARYAAHEMISQFNQNRNFDVKELEFRINLAEKKMEAEQKIKERADTARATESRFERSQKATESRFEKGQAATESRFNRLHGTSGSTEPHFSSSQLNKGAATAKMSFADFNKLDNDTKNFFINNQSDIKAKYKAIDKAFANKESPLNIEAEIKASNAPQAVKKVLIDYLYSVNESFYNKQKSGPSGLMKFFFPYGTGF